MKKRFSMGLALTVLLIMIIASAAAAAPVGDTVSNTLGLTVNVEEAVADPTIFVNDDLADTSAVGLYDCFTVGTTPGDYGDTPVRVKMAADPATGFALEYVEQDPNNSDYGKYLPLSVVDGEAWFGPGAGFPLGAVSDSMFRVTWNTAGTYTFTLSIMGGAEFDQELASTTVTVQVVAGDPIALTHAVDGEPVTPTGDPLSADVAAGGDIEYSVTAALDNGVSHIDNALYILEVSKDNISIDDFTIVGNPEGIQNTFEPDGTNMLRGHWGPAEGFTFAEETTTSMTTQFNTAGTYNVNIYAIQVEPAAGAF